MNREIQPETERRMTAAESGSGGAGQNARSDRGACAPKPCVSAAAGEPRIEAVIPVYHPDERLDAALELLSRQRQPVVCIHLMDTLRPDGSSSLRAELRNRPGVVVHEVPHAEFDHGGTRRLGASLCEGADYLLFMTQDAVPVGEELTAALLAGFSGQAGEDLSSGEPRRQRSGAFAQSEEGLSSEKPVVAVSFARQLARQGASVEERLTREFNYPGTPSLRTRADLDRLGIKTYFCSNVCAMYDARVYRALGGFVQRTIFNEDMLYAAAAVQAGYAVFYAAAAEVVHSHAYTAEEQLRRNFDLGVSQAEHPEVFLAIRSEREGMRYVRTMLRALRANGAGGEIPGFLLRCAARFIGYRAGRSYRRLPMALIRRLTMSPNYWKETGKSDHHPL